MKKHNLFYLLLPVLLVIIIAANTDKIKNVLIIGDSISIGYTPYVQKALMPNTIVEHNPGNGGSTVRGVENISNWIGNKEWDVILFNFGLHDMVHKDSLNNYDVNGKVAVTLEDYRKNLEIIVGKLRETTATIIFISTTEVPEKASGRMVEDPAKYNAVALDVMKSHGVEVIDLYKASLTIHPQNSVPGNVHYTETGYALLADLIIQEINKVLKK